MVNSIGSAALVALAVTGGSAGATNISSNAAPEHHEQHMAMEPTVAKGALDIGHLFLEKPAVLYSAESSPEEVISWINSLKVLVQHTGDRPLSANFAKDLIIGDQKKIQNLADGGKTTIIRSVKVGTDLPRPVYLVVTRQGDKYEVSLGEDTLKLVIQVAAGGSSTQFNNYVFSPDLVDGSLKIVPQK